MMIELSKSDYVWFSKFLGEFLRMKKSHVLNGLKIPDKTMDNILNMTKITPIKGGTYLIPIEETDVDFIAVLLEDCVMCCPGCSLSSVRHRKNISNKVLRLIEDIDTRKEEEEEEP